MRRNPQTVPAFALSVRKVVGFLHPGYHLFSFLFQEKSVMIKTIKMNWVTKV